MGSLVRSVVRALLYVRVSTDEQARSGFSLGQQLEALRSYCQDHGIEVMGEFEDRSSGASLDRAGLDTLRDVVAGGGIDLVLCQDRDRISREPAHVYILREELREHGTTLRALNDRGDDSPEGELTDGILDQLAKFERAKTVERTRRGKLRKAQEGKVVGTGRASYGFYYADDHYHIDPERMPYVHEIFERAAAGDSLYSIVQHLTKIGAPTPGNGKWHATTLREIILNDTYMGVLWWGRERVTTTTISKVENGERTYKKKAIREPRPPSEWIAIPVPASGVPHETITRARENIKGNIKAVSKNNDRVWELSGGVGVCSECGFRMVAYTSLNPVKKIYYYYRCPNRKYDNCSNRKHYRAGDLEMQVNDAIVNAFHPSTWADFVNDLCDRRLSDLHRLHRSPNRSKERLAKRIGDLETRASRARDLFIVGDLTRPEYEEKKASIQEETQALEQELSKVDDLDDEISRVEHLRNALLSIENPLSGHYAFIPGDIDFDLTEAAKVDDSLGYGSKEMAARRRQEFYRRVGMRVKVGEELEISLGIGEPLVSKNGTPSAWTRA
jgi:site-specific DNA recombinase